MGFECCVNDVKMLWKNRINFVGLKMGKTPTTQYLSVFLTMSRIRQ